MYLRRGRSLGELAACGKPPAVACSAALPSGRTPVSRRGEWGSLIDAFVTVSPPFHDAAPYTSNAPDSLFLPLISSSPRLLVTSSPRQPPPVSTSLHLNSPSSSLPHGWRFLHGSQGSLTPLPDRRRNRIHRRSVRSVHRARRTGASRAGAEYQGDHRPGASVLREGDGVYRQARGLRGIGSYYDDDNDNDNDDEAAGRGSLYGRDRTAGRGAKPTRRSGRGQGAQ
jgi:hypothetical protein